MSKIAFSAPKLGRDETCNCSSWVEKASLELRTHAARLRDGLDFKSNLTFSPVLKLFMQLFQLFLGTVADIVISPVRCS